MAAVTFLKKNEYNAFMRYSIIYFSGTGNTRWASKTLNDILIERGNDCSIHPINDSEGAFESALSSEMIILATPIYAADIPRIMRNFICLLSERLCKACSLRRKIIFVNTFAYVNGAGYIRAARVIRDTCFEITGYINLRMTNTAPSGKPAVFGESINDSLKRKIYEKLSRLVPKLEAGKRVIDGMGPVMLSGFAVRKALRKRIGNNYLNMHADMDLCTRCMECIRKCPSGSISIVEGKLHFSDTCEACMRCINHCPESAIANNEH